MRTDEERLMKREALDHPKVEDLAEELEGLGVPADFSMATATGVLERLWGLTARHAPDGDLARFRARRIARFLGWGGPAEALVEALVRCGWLDSEGDQLRVHDWPEHADRHVHRALIRRGERFADGSAPHPSAATREERERWEAADAQRAPSEGAHRARSGGPVGASPSERAREPEPERESRSAKGAPRRRPEARVEEEEEDRSDDETHAIDCSPPGPPKWALLRLLSKKPGTVEEKRAWFEYEWPMIEAEAQCQATKKGTSEQEELRRTVVAFYAQYIAEGRRRHAPGPVEAVH